MHLLEQRVERIGAEPGCRSDAHVDSEFVLLDPPANSGHVVLVQECHVVGLERMVQVHRYAPIEFAILREHEDGKGSVVPVFLLLEK